MPFILLFALLSHFFHSFAIASFHYSDNNIVLSLSSSSNVLFRSILGPLYENFQILRRSTVEIYKMLQIVISRPLIVPQHRGPCVIVRISYLVISNKQPNFTISKLLLSFICSRFCFHSASLLFVIFAFVIFMGIISLCDHN